ncbi:MAG: hypothetical protein Q9163_001882 [Psora crenata]
MTDLPFLAACLSDRYTLCEVVFASPVRQWLVKHVQPDDFGTKNREGFLILGRTISSRACSPNITFPYATMSPPHPFASSLSIKQAESSPSTSATPSVPPSREGLRPTKDKHKVQWNRAAETQEMHNRTAMLELPSDESSEDKGHASTPLLKQSITHRRRDSTKVPMPQHRPGRSKTPSPGPTSRPRPPILKKTSDKSQVVEGYNRDKAVKTGRSLLEQAEADVAAPGKAFSQQSAQERDERLAWTVGLGPAPALRSTTPAETACQTSTTSPPRTPPPSPLQGHQGPNLDLSGYPMQMLEAKRAYGRGGDESENSERDRDHGSSLRATRPKFLIAARRLMRYHGQKDSRKWFQVQPDEPASKSGQTTPIAERDPVDYVPRPKQYREGVMGSLVKLYSEQDVGSTLANIPLASGAINRAQNERHSVSHFLFESEATTPTETPISSPAGLPQSPGTPKSRTSTKPKPLKWYKKPRSYSTSSIADLASSSTSLAEPGRSRQATAVRSKRKQKPLSAQAVETMPDEHQGPPKVEDAIRIQMHVADVMQRKAFLLKICRALMAYGAPTHRLEEYMRMSARVLEIDGQFLYMPGCMLISFGDAAWHTTDVRLVRCAQKVNISKLYETHVVYKEVIHDVINVEEAIERLDNVSNSADRFHKWWLIVVYGLASVCVGPFAFGARPIDLPIAFILGCLLGYMQLILAPRSDLYSNIFEISAAMLTSFIARAFGSINNGNTFCFSALAQSSIALILPGYTVLCGSLELQSKNIVAGSIRMVYAIIYSLFLGFGITVGTSIYGALDQKATSETSCKNPWPFWWEAIFVPPFTMCLIIINHGGWKNTPLMVLLAMIGYIVNHYSAIRFASNAQIAQTLSALAIGVIANWYSRLRHALAAAILLPAIFVQVPSGLAASGSLVSGVTSANQIIKNNGNYTSGVTTVVNGTQAAGGDAGVKINIAVLNVGYSMIQIAIGITVGLFLSALVIYPLGKRRSGLFSF